MGHLGIAIKRKPVYVSENLSPLLKDLHAASGKKAKETWTGQQQTYTLEKTRIHHTFKSKNKDSLELTC